MTDVDDLFNDPGEGTNVKWRELSGRLLLLYPEEKTLVQTKDYGEKEAIRARIVVLDGPDSPLDMPGCLVFPLFLQGQLRDTVGTHRPVIGRLTGGALEGTRDEKAWKLAKATDQDKAVAVAYVKKQPPPDKFNDVPF